MLVAFALPSFAFAQDASPLQLRVKPSGVEDAPNANVARQKRLLERMVRNDFMLRSICTSCGDSWKHNSYAPFNPMRTLGGASENMATEQVTIEEVERVVTEEP
jgi:hypothetical protein